MPTSKLNHIALTVSNRAHSAKFYGDYFGLTDAIHEDDHLLILSDGSGGLFALSVGTPDATWKRTTHFGFELENAQAVRALRQTFADAGIAKAEWQESGPTRVQVFDPDGYRVEAYGW